ncbi:hypothetical protein GCM10023144_14970 [Pigmentiphaga soli]|uniref:Cellulose biosynthesis protein BcsO n=1 Tax=Pigmentiphaga soli TaxID=1007095 RepID=A0ABP8GRW4_9BURK
MDDSDDIANLFKQFGGQVDQYQEIGRANEAKLSRERWPLLSSVEATRAAPIPPVRPGAGQPAASGAPAAQPFLNALRPPGPGRVEPQLAPAAAPQAPFIPQQTPFPQQPPQARQAAPAAASPPAPAALASTPAPAAATPAAAKPAPKAEFIPPRPRGGVQPAGREPGPGSPLSFNFMASSTPAAESPAAPAPPVPSAPAAASTASAPQDLQSIFARLAQPPRPEPAPSSDPNATLLQRLRRL